MILRSSIHYSLFPPPLPRATIVLLVAYKTAIGQKPHSAAINPTLSPIGRERKKRMSCKLNQSYLYSGRRLLRHRTRKSTTLFL